MAVNYNTTALTAIHRTTVIIARIQSKRGKEPTIEYKCRLLVTVVSRHALQLFFSNSYNWPEIAAGYAKLDSAVRPLWPIFRDVTEQTPSDDVTPGILWRNWRVSYANACELFRFETRRGDIVTWKRIAFSNFRYVTLQQRLWRNDRPSWRE